MRLIILSLLTILSFILGCTPLDGDTSYTEINRVTSPDSLVDAVLFQSNSGVTTSFGYRVFILPKGIHLNNDMIGHWVFSADHIDSLSIKWKENKYLEVSYNQARIFGFTNFWQAKEIQNYRYIVEIRLNPITSGFSLSNHDRFAQ
jgi:hypothetical protein